MPQLLIRRVCCRHSISMIKDTVSETASLMRRRFGGHLYQACRYVRVTLYFGPEAAHPLPAQVLCYTMGNNVSGNAILPLFPAALTP